MTKSLDLKRDDPRSHPFDTTAPSISRRALDHADLLSGDYWGELRTFLWVAKAGSLSKAAELLGSSHATVGREIPRLQDQMGSQLVVLTKNGAQLTQKGHALTDELLRLDQRLFSIASDLRAEKAEAEGAVRLGITDGLGVCFLVPELRRFSKKYPKIQVHLKKSRQLQEPSGESDGCDPRILPRSIERYDLPPARLAPFHSGRQRGLHRAHGCPDA